MTEETKEKPIRDVKLQWGMLQTADHGHTRWGATLTPDQTPEDVMRPDFWSIPAKRISAGDFIDVRTEDGRFYMELYVTDANDIGVRVQILRNIPLDGHIEGDIETAGYVVQWKGPSWKFCIVRRIDNTVAAKNLPTKEAAALWLQDNAKAA